MVGIISINRYSVHMNYGAALHSFAFQQCLDRLGFSNVIINYFPRFMEGYNLKYPILNGHTWKGYLKWLIGGRENVKKYKKFEHFFDTYCRYTKQVCTSFTIDNENFDNYNIDTFICESDVIWKPASTKGIEDAYFLNFPAANSCRKVAYAASVGLKMTGMEKARVKDLLQDFYAISVRERDSVDFIRNLYNGKVEWVIDPTLLLTKEDYYSYVKFPKEDNYLLVYNCMVNDKRMLRYAQSLANKLNLRMIEISAFPENGLLYKHVVKTDLGIEEFLGYFANASYVVCNAFHGSCFSLLFEKNFQLFQREEFDYRLKSIIEPLGLLSVYVPKNRTFENLSLQELDYSEINKKLNNFRNNSTDFILNALK